MRRLLISMLLVLSATACSQVPNTPEGVYRAFYAALTERDWDTAARYLSTDTLAAFRGVGDRLKEFVGSQQAPLDVFLQGANADIIRPLRRVEVVSREEGMAKLKVIAGPCGEGEKCQVSRVDLRREEGRWVICPKLPALFGKTGGREQE